METRSIALDGPSGAGKSTLAKKAAERFKMIYVDTGALYRCVALHVIRNNVQTSDAPEVSKLLHDVVIDLKYDADGVQRTFLNNDDVSNEIRLPEISMGASSVSAMPFVRDYLLSMQRELAVKYDVIMDGRDIGTVVIPNAGLKVYLTAAPETRAYRRYLELIEKNIATTLDDVLRDMIARDKSDTERELSPLKPAKDSIILDTTDLDLEESFEALAAIIISRFGI